LLPAKILQNFAKKNSAKLLHEDEVLVFNVYFLGIFF
jgi:hypothetical protein